MYIDYHVHTDFSDDSIYPIEEVVQKAISLGIEELCFTEHVDHGVKPQALSYQKGLMNTGTNCHYESYQKEYLSLKEKYSRAISLKFGIEFGMQTHTIAEFQKDFDQYPFDFVILSCHQVEDKEFWTQEFQQGKTQEEFQTRYYEEILRVISVYKNYSVLGHLDMIKRYDEYGNYPFSKTRDLITKILNMVIADGKGIEINTSSFRYGLTDLTPSRDILRLYKELGGKILTIGSDSHQEEHLGYQIQEIKEELKSLGFRSFCTFDKMVPMFHCL
ncbi:histidinol phosphate phosphatase [Vibrio sp. HA2012]|uniref:histidinol-phosphatase HisJ family protein n=1 Tax=Vibrio sp. HA2012 TaxID=1971595 RepID=UPI000C2CBCF3|nr:histidinol-phosphatase HisJ family protein [Vibrio sp. HA2012]PJC86836.1 histidinol phosphate phosphatase [Vibrio sp. HA2012]